VLRVRGVRDGGFGRIIEDMIGMQMHKALGRGLRDGYQGRMGGRRLVGDE